MIVYSVRNMAVTMYVIVLRANHSSFVMCDSEIFVLMFTGN